MYSIYSVQYTTPNIAQICTVLNMFSCEAIMFYSIIQKIKTNKWLEK